MSTEQFWDKGIMLVDGCTKVSPGCRNCWSEAMTARFKRVPEVLTDGRFNGSVQFNLHLLEKAAKRKEPTVYAIWNDLYHEDIKDEQIVKAFNIMDAAPHHTFLVVTKRPERAENKCNVLSHIWHIVTCENQEQADKRIPHLLEIPGKRGIIIEPMLETVDLTKSYPEEYCFCTGCGYHGLHDNYDNYECTVCQHTEDDPDSGGCGKCGGQMERVCPSCGFNDWNDGTCYGPIYTYREEFPKIPGIHQVICGPENGPGKRPFDPAWAESIKAQCEAAGVPYYRKDKAEGVLAWRR